jgi:hypothetical protein
MKGRTGDVLTPKQWRRLQATLPRPDRCDRCGAPLDEATRRTAPHGPFTVHLCPRCSPPEGVKAHEGQ